MQKECCLAQFISISDVITQHRAQTVCKNSISRANWSWKRSRLNNIYSVDTEFDCCWWWFFWNFPWNVQSSPKQWFDLRFQSLICYRLSTTFRAAFAFKSWDLLKFSTCDNRHKSQKSIFSMRVQYFRYFISFYRVIPIRIHSISIAYLWLNFFSSTWVVCCCFFIEQLLFLFLVDDFGANSSSRSVRNKHENETRRLVD